MQWFGKRESSNVEDRRNISGGGLAAGGGIIGVIVYLIYSFIGGGNIDPSQIPMPTTQQRTLTVDEQKQDDERANFVKFVLAET